ncbi:MAG: carboxypeptidase regulatory-like domain-containing protein [Deltaproteobacteria bacterium]|nr:carboxypeptidase regulatory-like domain-containing protein [Deltaproteobacteria bacterium]
MRRTLSHLAVAWCLAATSLVAVTESHATPIKGLLRLPPRYDVRGTSGAAGYWQFPNDTLDILPPLMDVRRSMVVVLDGAPASGAPSVAPQLVIEDSRVVPSVLPVSPGARVRFVNRDPVTHLLEPVGQSGMAPQRVGPGETIEQTFAAAGAHAVRCSETPHVQATVLVTPHKQVALPDGTGAFRFADVPPGNYTLRVWHQGQWIHAQPFAVKGKTVVAVEVQLPLPRPAGRAAGAPKD